MVPAITQVVAETDTDVNWGLKHFPDHSADACDVNTTAEVPIGPASGAAISAAIMAATSANGGVVGFNGTPTRSAADGATDIYAVGHDRADPKFILLATDGMPTCPDGRPDATRAAGRDGRRRSGENGRLPDLRRGYRDHGAARGRDAQRHGDRGRAGPRGDAQRTTRSPTPPISRQRSRRSSASPRPARSRSARARPPTDAPTEQIDVFGDGARSSAIRPTRTATTTRTPACSRSRSTVPCATRSRAARSRTSP